MIPYPACTRYHVLTSDIGVRYHAALYTNPRLAASTLDDINVNIGARSSIIADMFDIPDEMSSECRRHFHPDSNISMGFSPLTVTVLSGAFTVLPVMFFFSFVVFVAEHRVKSRQLGNNRATYSECEKQ